jgi:hypothetical protein
LEDPGGTARFSKERSTQAVAAAEDSLARLVEGCRSGSVLPVFNADVKLKYPATFKLIGKDAARADSAKSPSKLRCGQGESDQGREVRSRACEASCCRRQLTD